MTMIAQRFLRFSREYKMRTAWIVGIFASILYGAVGRITLHLSPQQLEFSAIDRAVPLVPWTLWPYLSIYLIYFVSSYFQKDARRFSIFVVAFALAYCIASVIFLLYPTHLPREFLDLSSEPGMNAKMLQLFYHIDKPTNCLPSLHVGTAVICIFPFLGRRPFLAGLFAIWALIIAVSTLTTKQHYFVDTITGALFGGVCYLLAAWLVRRLEPLETELYAANSAPAAIEYHRG